MYKLIKSPRHTGQPHASHPDLLDGKMAQTIPPIGPELPA